MPGSRVRVPPFPPIESGVIRAAPKDGVRRKRTVSARIAPSFVFDRENQAFSPALISVSQNGAEVLRPYCMRWRPLAIPYRPPYLFVPCLPSVIGTSNVRGLLGPSRRPPIRG